MVEGGAEQAAQEAAEKAKFPIPNWATKAPAGSHLDVVKNDQLIQVCSFLILF